MKTKTKALKTARGVGVALLKHRKAGAHKHKNTPRGGAQKPNHHEGW
jgi:hypothetical protein